jgi:hypothetical protein
MDAETNMPPVLTRRLLLNLTWSLVATDLALILLHSLTDLALFNLDREISIPTWYSSAKLLAVAALSALLFAHPGRGSTGRALWLVNGLLFFGLAVDESASIHERLSRWLLERSWLQGLRDTLTGGDEVKASFAWVGLFLPLIVAVVIFFVVLVRRGLAGLPRAKLCFWCGLALLLVALGLEALVMRFPDVVDWGSLEASRYRQLTTFEECAELIGVTLLFTAVGLRVAAENDPRTD